MSLRRLFEKLGIVVSIMGVGPDIQRHYITQIRLTPETPWGRLVLHRFHFTDRYCAPHEHGSAFYTLPFTSYVEMVMDRETFEMRRNVVKRWRWHYRPQIHTHQVIGPEHDRHEHFTTLVWRCPYPTGTLDFFFWEPVPGQPGKRRKVPQEGYVAALNAKHASGAEAA